MDAAAVDRHDRRRVRPDGVGTDLVVRRQRLGAGRGPASTPREDTTGSEATEEHSESWESRAPRAFWTPESLFEHYPRPGERIKNAADEIVIRK